MRISDWSSDVCSSDLWIGLPTVGVGADMPDFSVLPVPKGRLLSAIDRLGPLLATEAQVETAAAAIDLAQAEKRPDWSVAASYGQRSDGREELFMLEFGIELPLFTANPRDRERKSAGEGKRGSV